jgi:predicted nucleotidyltransferase
MASIINQLYKQKLINPTSYIVNTHYETIMGSEAYGVNRDFSDRDIYAFCIPSKEIVFPHLAGEINGFGRQKKSFEVFQQHHIDYNKTSYDIQVYNIVKYFSLCMENNPNMIDSLYTPHRCVIHCSDIGEMVRSNRHLFLHKGMFFKFKGYSFSQLNKARTKVPIGKRKQVLEKFGVDVKFLYHVVRLVLECEQALIEGTIDLERNRDHLLAIREGSISLEEVEKWFNEKERTLEKLYTESTVLPYSPDEDKIKQLLLNCLEHWYGSLQGSIIKEDKASQCIEEISQKLKEYGY